jgi:hypothetical protein
VDALEEAIEHYRRFGYVIIDDLIPSSLMEEALHGVERHHAGERDIALPSGLGFLDWRPGDSPGIRINDYASLQNEEIHALVTYSPIAAVAALLSASSCIRLFHDQIIFKDPVDVAPDTTIGFHTDRAYWQTCSSLEMLTAWIPLTPCCADSGPISVIPGSHLWPGNDQLAGFFNQAPGASPGKAEISSQPSARPVPLTLQPGQVSFHHCRMVHGSDVNRTATPRCAVTVHLQDAANHYVPPQQRGRRTVHVNDLLCRRSPDGIPDYADPFVSPILFEGNSTCAAELIASAGEK